MIKINNMTKTYNKNKVTAFEALHGIDFSVEKGEMIALVGTSGAGKSTLLHIISCIDTFDSGEYYLDGENLSHVSESKRADIRNRKIGIVMQDFALVEDFSVIDNVSIPLYFTKNKDNRRKRKELVMNALEEIGIADLAKKRVNQLSGGQRQRVSIARAIANNPGLILADEPTGALDGKNSEMVMELFKKLNESGRTIIVVTHDMNVASKCDRIVRIEDGCIMSE